MGRNPKEILQCVKAEPTNLHRKVSLLPLIKSDVFSACTAEQLSFGNSKNAEGGKNADLGNCTLIWTADSHHVQYT